jgi:hypothetical protein
MNQPSTSVPSASHAPGGGELDQIDEHDKREVDKVVPRSGETSERDLATEPDKIEPSPDDAGERPRPL